MKTYFVTRHAGAKDWAEAQGFGEVEIVEHFNPSVVEQGDKVLGTLPVHLAAEVCSNGGEYYHLTLNLTPEMRGKELSVQDMEAAGARLEHYNIIRGE